MKAILATAVILLSQSSLLAGSGFISSVGENRPFPDVTVRVYPENGKIQYRVRSGSSEGGPTRPEIEKDSGWFIYPESEKAFWIYMGGGVLSKMEFNGNETKFVDSEVVKTLLDTAPAEVRNRVAASTDKE